MKTAEVVSHLTELEKALWWLTDEDRLRFCAACCERLLNCLVVMEGREHQVVRVLRGALDDIWGMLALDRVAIGASRREAREIAKTCRQLVDDSDELDDLAKALIVDIVDSVALVAEALTAVGMDRAVQPNVRLVPESLINTVHAFVNSPVIESVHPLVEAEVTRQQSDLAALSKDRVTADVLRLASTAIVPTGDLKLRDHLDSM